MLEQALNGAETLYHYLLADAHTTFRLIPVIPARGNHGTVPVVGLAVADDNHREHINLFGIKTGQRSYRHLLLISSCLAHVTDRGIR